MSTQLTCSLGHSWHVPDDATEVPAAATCPVCGRRSQPGNANGLDTATLPPPTLLPDSSGDGGPDEEVSIPGYEVLGELGRGGMGVVYKARQGKLHRLVALKMILSGAHAGAGDLARFRTEAEAVARLQHPGIVQIYEVGEHRSLPFFSLEFVEGGSLTGVLDGTPCPPRDAARFVQQLADAMHYAHERGIVHRDLKPGNVLLTAAPAHDHSSSGTGTRGGPAAGLGRWAPKITDFGLAKLVSGEEAAPAAGVLTQTGAILGTPSYMAPEQARGESKRIGPAADIYALGAILYELLTGRPPFRASTPLDTVLQVMSEEPVSVSRLQPGVPRDLETICLKCLQKEPRQRYATAQALSEDLHRFLAGLPVQARTISTVERFARWCRRKPAAATALLFAGLAALALVACAVVGAFLFQQARAAERLRQEQARTEEERRRSDQLATSLALERGRALCEQGEAGRGLLWLAHGLRIAPAHAPELARDARLSLATWSRHLHPLRATWPQPAPIWAIAVSPDGETVASAGLGREVRECRLRDGATVGNPITCPSSVSALAYSPDGRTLATGGWDGQARLWDRETGKERVHLIHRGPVRGVAFSPDGRKILTASQDGTASVWDARTGERVGEPLAHPDEVWAAAWSPDGTVVLTGCQDRHARLWDVTTGKVTGTPFKHAAPVSAVDFLAVGRPVTGSLGGTAQVWDAGAGRPVGPALVHGGEVWCVACTADGKRLVTGGADGMARVWDTGTGERLGSPLPHRDVVWAAAFAPDGRTVLTGSEDRGVRQWTLGSGRLAERVLKHGGMVEAVAYGDEGRVLAAGGSDGLIRLWSAETGEPLGAPLTRTGQVTVLACPPRGRLLLAGGSDGVVSLWDLGSGKAVAEGMRHEGAITVAGFSPDGKTVATGSRDRTARIWDAATGRARGGPLPHADRVTAVAFSPDGRLLLTASGDGIARLWEAEQGQPHGEPLQHHDWVWTAAFDPQGEKLATGCADGSVHIWDILGRESSVLWGHQGAVYCLGYGPGGKVLATGGGDGTLRLWDARTGEAIGGPCRHQGAVRSLAFSPKGDVVATGSSDGTARLWEASTGRPLSPPLPHGAAIRSLAFGPDGQTILTGGGHPNALLWRRPTVVEEPIEQLSLRIQDATGMALGEDGGVGVLDASAWQEQHARFEQMLAGKP